MLLLGFLLVIAVSLTLWAALTLGAPPERALGAIALDGDGAPLPTAQRPSNDDVRGARASVRRREERIDDAFERFVRSDRRPDEPEF